MFVDLDTGNEARHFRFDNNTATAQALATSSEPAPVVYNYTNIESYSFVGVLCLPLHLVHRHYIGECLVMCPCSNKERCFRDASTECASPAVVLAEGDDSTVEQFWISDETMLAVLDLEVDYEVETSYTMVIEVVDFLRTPSLTGQATLKVYFPLQLSSRQMSDVETTSSFPSQ